MNELQKLIEKWDEQIALHRRVCDEPLMYTKEDRLLISETSSFED